MPGRLTLLAAVGRHAATLPDRVADMLVLRDMDRWLRLEFLGVAARTKVADAVVQPATVEDVAAQTGIVDLELLESFLQLGVALGELRQRGDRFDVKGVRLRAVTARSDDLRGLVEEVVTYDSPIYMGLAEHLFGAPARDYLDGVGDVIARASRIVEPVLAPTVRSIVTAVAPSRVLDVGCGSGAYLGHVLDAAPNATALGIDLDPTAVETARTTLATPVAQGRCELRSMRLDEVDPEQDGPFDLLLLLNNIYYWPPDERPAVLAGLRALVPSGSVVVATAVPNRQAFNRHLDLVLRVTEGSWRLPTAVELRDDLRRAGFTAVEVIEPIPGAGVVIAVGSP